MTQPEGPRGSQASTLCSPGAEEPGQWGTEPTGSSYSLCSLPKAVAHLAGLSLPVLKGQQTIPGVLLCAQALSWWMRPPPTSGCSPMCRKWIQTQAQSHSNGMTAGHGAQERGADCVW